MTHHKFYCKNTGLIFVNFTDNNTFISNFSISEVIKIFRNFLISEIIHLYKLIRGKNFTTTDKIFSTYCKILYLKFSKKWVSKKINIATKCENGRSIWSNGFWIPVIIGMAFKIFWNFSEISKIFPEKMKFLWFYNDFNAI